MKQNCTEEALPVSVSQLEHDVVKLWTPCQSDGCMTNKWVSSLPICILYFQCSSQFTLSDRSRLHLIVDRGPVIAPVLFEF